MKFLVLMVLFFTIPLMATGPRVTQSLISPDKKEIFALDIPPFISTEVKAGGALKEIAEAVFQEADLDITITILPIQSMVKYYLTQENAIGIMGRHIGLSSKERKSLVEIPLYVAHERYFYFKPLHKKGLSYNGKLKSFKGLTYGASKGEDTSAYKNAGVKVKKARTLSLLKKLKSAKVDFISLPKESVLWFIKENFSENLNDFVMMKKSSAPASVSLYFNLNHPDGKESLKKFKKGLQNIVNSGVYADILKKHVNNMDKIELQVKRMKKYLK